MKSEKSENVWKFQNIQMKESTALHSIACFLKTQKANALHCLL